MVSRLNKGGTCAPHFHHLNGANGMACSNRNWGLALSAAVLIGSLSAAPPTKDNKAEATPKAVLTARDKGLDWLKKNQATNGSWGKTYSIAVTSFACLSYLSATDEPFRDDRGKALLKGLQF